MNSCLKLYHKSHFEFIIRAIVRKCIKFVLIVGDVWKGIFVWSVNLHSISIVVFAILLALKLHL